VLHLPTSKRSVYGNHDKRATILRLYSYTMRFLRCSVRQGTSKISIGGCLESHITGQAPIQFSSTSRTVYRPYVNTPKAQYIDFLQPCLLHKSRMIYAFLRPWDSSLQCFGTSPASQITIGEHVTIHAKPVSRHFRLNPSILSILLANTPISFASTGTSTPLVNNYSCSARLSLRIRLFTFLRLTPSLFTSDTPPIQYACYIYTLLALGLFDSPA